MQDQEVSVTIFPLFFFALITSFAVFMQVFPQTDNSVLE